jgi:hypothetical protein
VGIFTPQKLAHATSQGLVFLILHIKKIMDTPGVVVHAWNPSTEEAETGES